MQQQRVTGRFPVGLRDFEYDVASVESTRPMDIPPDQHLVGQLYYPCTKQKRAQQATWIPHFVYAQGFSEFAFKYSQSWAKGMGKVALRNLAWWMGSAKLPCWRDVPPAASLQQAPLVVLSHGMGGNRFCSSLLCSHLASQGYIVMALEHTDGSGSTAKMAGKRPPLFFSGWMSDEDRPRQIRHRMAECRTALRLATALSGGEGLTGLSVSGPEGTTCFKGRVDAACAALAGHSYGGLTVGALTAEEPAFSCGVAIDPWWGGLEPEAAARHAWATDSPLLILGSHAWNQPNRSGRVMCDTTGQDQVMRAAAHRKGSSEEGPGAVLLVVEGSSHDTCIDVRAIFGAKYGWAIKPLMGRHTRVEGAQQLDAQDGIDITASCMAHFLRHHLPLTAAQRDALDSACETVSVHGGEAHSTSQGLSSGDGMMENGAKAKSDFAAEQAGGSSSSSSNGDAGRRTRSHRVDAADLEALKQVAHGRIFTCRISDSEGIQQAMPASST